jgi:tetratricopeptide (TPR) repeat protein
LAIVIALLIFSIPAVANKAGLLISKIVAESVYYPKALMLIIFGAGLSVLFVSLRSNNFIMGDGYVLIGSLFKNRTLWPLEPLEFYWHSILYFLFGGGETAAYMAYRFWSTIMGLVFFVGLFYFYRGKAFLWATAIVGTFAGMQLFFGYIENYATSYVLIIFYIIFAIRDLDNKKLSLPTILCLVIAAAFHLGNIIYFPSLVYLFWKLRGRGKAFFIFFGLLTLISIILAIYLIPSHRLNVGRVIIPILPNSQSPYYLLSSSKLFDLVNWILLLFPLVIALPFLSFFRKIMNKSFWAAVLVPGFCLMIFFDPTLGAIRDWDLMAMVSAPLLAMTTIYYISSAFENRERAYSILLPLFIFAILHTGSWVIMNHSKIEAYQYIKSIIKDDLHYSKDYLDGYRNKHWSFIAQTVFNDCDEVIRACEIRFKGDPSDVATITTLSQCYLELGDTARAYAIIMGSSQRYNDDSKFVAAMAELMIDMKYYPQAESIYQSYIENFGTDYHIYNNFGMLKEKQGKADSAFYLYDLAFRVRPDAPIDDQFRFYIYCISQEQQQIAFAGITRIYNSLRANQKLLADEIQNALIQNNKVALDNIIMKFGGLQ